MGIHDHSVKHGIWFSGLVGEVLACLALGVWYYAAVMFATWFCICLWVRWGAKEATKICTDITIIIHIYITHRHVHSHNISFIANIYRHECPHTHTRYTRMYILYYIILLYCIMLWYVILYCLVWYSTTLHCITLYYSVLHCITLYSIILNGISMKKWLSHLRSGNDQKLGSPFSGDLKKPWVEWGTTGRPCSYMWQHVSRISQMIQAFFLSH